MPTNILNLPTEETLQSIATALATMQGNVSGVKGNAEITYRTGQVNLTAADIGALPSTTTYVSSVNGGSGAVVGIATQQELNEVRTIAEGAGAAMSFSDYATLVSDFNNATDDEYKLGQSIYVNTLNVPDLWIYEVSNIQILYYYTTDEAFTDLLRQQGYVQIGYYKVAALETQKVDLSNYVSLDGAQTITGVKSFTDFSLINDYTNGKTLASYLSGKVDTNADSIFNVISATDIAVSNILTQAQIDVITNGKPTIIKGTFLDYDNPILCSVRTASNYGNRSYVGAWLGSKQAGLATYAVFTIMNTGLIKIEKALIYYNLQASNEMMAYFGDVTASRNLYFNKGYSTGSTLQLGWSNGNIAIESTASTFKVACNNFISRNGTNSSDIGSSTVKWKDLYLAGEINPNASGYGYTLPDTTNFTANKEVATTDLRYEADLYSSSSTYAVGDLVVCNTKLYRCTTAITTAEEWNSAHWAEVTIASALNSQMTISGAKTFLGNLLIGNYATTFPKVSFKGANSGRTVSIQAENYKLKFLAGTADTEIGNITSGNPTTEYYYSFQTTRPLTNNTFNLGVSSHQWKDLYLAGKMNPNSSGYGVTIPDTTSFTANREIATNDIISDAYDNTATYAVGDCCIYNNTLYKCNTAITTAEDFDSTKWDIITITELISNETIVRTTGDQIVAGKKKFTGTPEAKEMIFRNNVSSPTGSALSIQNDNGYNAKIRFNNRGFMFTAGSVYPSDNNVMNFGATNYLWKNIYVSGNLSDGTNNVSVADIANGTFNVINASDISSNTLTQAQYDLIINGKPTLIKGELLGYSNPEISCPTITGALPSDSLFAIIKGHKNNKYTTVVSILQINVQTRVISLYSGGQASYMIFDFGTIGFTGGLSLGQASSSVSIKGKALPSYPSSPANAKVLTYNTNNTMSWEDASSGGMSNPMTTADDIIIGGSSGTPTRLAKGNNTELLRVNGSGNLAYGKNLPIITSAPSANNSDGLIICVLSSEPATKYDGYLYIITSSN